MSEAEPQPEAGEPEDEADDELYQLTGDLYLNADQYEPWHWAVTAVLCLVLPPVGLFLAGWMVVGSIEGHNDSEVSAA